MPWKIPQIIKTIALKNISLEKSFNEVKNTHGISAPDAAAFYKKYNPKGNKTTFQAWKDLVGDINQHTTI